MAGGSTLYSTAARELSYLNLLDAEAAWQLVHELVGPHGLSFSAGMAAAVIVKHTNACGAAVASDLATAYQKALEGDRVAAFGGIVALSGQWTGPSEPDRREPARRRPCGALV